LIEFFSGVLFTSMDSITGYGLSNSQLTLNTFEMLTSTTFSNAFLN